MNTWTFRVAAAVLGLVFIGALGYGLTHASQPFSSRGSGSPALVSGPPAPEFQGIVDWENSAPLRMSRLRGKVVLVDFWTYSCINCQRTFPYLRDWWHRYRSEGLVIVGVHSPEFAFEKDFGNIRKAIQRYGVEWPVAVDSNMATWTAYQNQYWPAEYLVDAHGDVRHTRFGEGGYAETERNIQTLLAAAGHKIPAGALSTATPGIGTDADRQTAELYVGRPEFMGDPGGLMPGRPYLFIDASLDHANNLVYLAGLWTIDETEGSEHAAHARASSPGQDYALINYIARRVFMVAEPARAGVRAYITLDGRDLTPASAGSDVKFDAAGHAYVDINRSDLYALVRRGDFQHHVLKVSPVDSGFRLYTFTFGS